ncbi:hypothetical protein NCS56_01013600 [Fusarium sp. Ph1]|nr:hypothetical protein NCS56_01013600 [Fusarium sp. Ph1]
MHFSLVIATALLLLSRPASAQNMTEICAGAPGIQGCTGAIKIPVKAQLKTCRTKYYSIDPCKTKKTFRYPCPIWSDPFRMCDGTACVPGTVEKWTDAPCGINVITKTVSVCQSIRDTLGGAGSSFIDKANTLCNCLPQMLWLVNSGRYDSAFRPDGLLKVESDVVTNVIRLQNCFLEKELGVKDNRNEVYAKELTPKDGWLVFTAPEITSATYAELAVAVSPCLTGVGCNPIAVTAFFTRYVKSAALGMGLQVANLLLGWAETFGSMKTKVLTIIGAANTIKTSVGALPGKVDTIKKTACKGKLCSGPGVSAFLSKVNKAIAAAQSLQNIRQSADKAASAIPEMISIADKAIEVTKKVPNSGFFMDLIQSGSFTKVTDILESIQIVKKLPESVKEIEATVGPVQELVSKYEPLVKTVSATVKEVTSFSWTPYIKELEADSSGKLRGLLTGLQNTIQLQLGESLDDLTTEIKNLKDALATFPVSKSKFDYDADVTYYSRWSEVSVPAPCSKQNKANFELSGYKTSYNYPSFYRCDYGPQRVPWPRHFVPYMKIKMS